MASLIGETVFECNGQAPAPSKDFYQLVITKKEVIWRFWKISLRSEFRNTNPGELRETHKEYLDDSSLQAQIATVFGANIVSYTLNLCRGNFDYLERLPDALLLYLILYLDLEDVAQLSQTSRRFEKLCSSDALWERIVENSCDTITPEMTALSKEVGWKQIFFTNKLQLQMQIRRRRQTSENLVV
ncbi:F-box only protein 36-like [Acipenser oxyrinchus oxyrinchus]|uniref:F-box only protein 36-like n=1 Tax=Acipenser oxyrinchus oxyrinchus TaxID=40147 RepID=A0AAD8D4X9_ACIOX|nr:F-box only protein 36-like [Acipenser oxyrinchus oxyrinchus]